MLFSTYHHHSATLLIFIIIVMSIANTRFIYVASASSIFHFHFHINESNDFIETGLVFCTFLRICPAFLEWRKQIIFKKQKSRLTVLRSFCLIFCEFQPGDAYKSVAYKEKSEYMFCIAYKGSQLVSIFFFVS